MENPEEEPVQTVQEEVVQAPPVQEEMLQEEMAREEILPEDLLPDEPPAAPFTMEDAKLKAVLEAIIYVTDEPLSLEQICIAVEQPRDRVIDVLEQLTADYEKPERGLSIREVAGGFKMATKPEHHEEVRQFVKNLNPPMKLSLPALETLAVIAYKQPITAPEIMEIRGVQGAGVLTTLLSRKLIGIAGKKKVVGSPTLYKTTREFLVQFGLKDLSELPSLKEFQELARQSTETPEPVLEPVPEAVQEPLMDSPPADSQPPDSQPADSQPASEQESEQTE
jgi:segregation and condensation protein B